MIFNFEPQCSPPSLRPPCLYGDSGGGLGYRGIVRLQNFDNRSGEFCVCKWIVSNTVEPACMVHGCKVNLLVWSIFS